MKKKIIIAISIIVGIFAIVSITKIVNSAKKSPDVIAVAPDQMTTKKDIPATGKPTDYSVSDNVAFLAGLLEKKSFQTITNGKASAKVGFIPYTQTVFNKKIVSKDGILQETVSEGFKKVAGQNYFFDNKVLVRKADKIDGSNTTWSDKTPTAINYNQFSEQYGLIPNEISGHVINEKTILDTSTLAEVDGGYQIVLYLNVQTAPYYYQRQVASHAGADGYPSFEEIKLTINFNDKWEITNLLTSEIYYIGIPVLGDLRIKNELTEDFTYDESLSIAELSYFEQYKSLEVEEGPVEAAEMTPIDYLQCAFGGYFTEPGYFDVTLNIGSNPIKGNLYLDLGIMDIVGNFKDVAFRYAEDQILINIGSKTFKASINDFKNMISNTPATQSDLSASLDTDKLMEDLENATITKTDTQVFMDATLNILEQNIQLRFVLDKSGTTYVLNRVEASATIEGVKIKAELSVSEKFTLPTFDSENATDLASVEFVVEDVLEIIKSKQVSINASANIDDYDINANLNITWNEDFLIDGKVNVNINGSLVEIFLYYRNDEILFEWNNLKCRISITELMNNIDISAPNISINLIINIIFNIDYKSLINDFKLTSNNITIDFNLKDKNIIIEINDLDDGFIIETNLYEFNISLSTKVDSFKDVNSDDYVSLDFLFNYKDTILSLVNSEAYELNIQTSIQYQEYLIGIEGVIYLDKDLNITGNLTATIEGKTYTVNLEMIDKVIYLHFYNIHVSIPLSELLGVETTTQNIYINNINISLENDNGQLVIVVGLETLGELRVKVINTESGINLEISDLNINGIEILNTTASLESTSKVEVLKQDFEYITYEDITKTISSIKELVDLINNGAEISLDITYENIQITGNIIIDLNRSIKGLIDINGYEIELIYIDSKLYISVLGINLTCDLTDPNELIEVIEKVLNELGTETPKLAIDLEEILSSMILDLSNGIKLTVSGYEITLKDNLLTTDFGTISITSNTESIVTPVGDYYEVENLYSYVDTILALVNSEAYELNIETSIQYQEYLIAIEGVIYLDKDLNITGNLTATIEGKNYTVNLEMIDKVIYLHFYNIHVSIPLSELLGVETTTQNFDINNINISLENDNGQLVIVVGLETLGELRVKVINTETGINLEISDLNINGIEILNTTASLESTSKVEVLKQDFEYITYEDITKTISSIKELVDLINNGAEISLDITYENIQITGNIIIDSNKAIKGLIDINGYEIELIYIDSKLYISVLGINLSCDLTDPNELIEVIEKVLNELGTETPKLAIDLEEILSSMILDLSDGIKLTVSGYEITLKDNLLTTDFGTISLTSNTESIVTPVGDYYEVENLYSYIDTILALVNSEAYELNIETSIKYKTYTIDLNGVIYLDKDLNITGNLTATIEGKTYTVNLEMIDKVIYLHFYNIHVSIPLSELLGVETTTQNFDINNINISLENDNGQLVIVVGLETLGEIRVKVINTETGINLEISDLNINGIEILNTTASLESTSKVEVLKQDFEYITYEDITKTISSIKELVDLINNGAEISLDITYENIQITGNIIIDSNKAIKGLIDINGYEIELIYIDSKLYISVLGINLSCDLTDPNELIEVIEKVLNELGTETPKLAIDLEEILSSMILDLSDGIKLTVSGYEITLKDNLLTTDFGTISITSNTESIVTPVGDYYEVENLYSYIDTILALVNSEAYELNIETSIKYKTYTIDLNGVIYLDKDLNITGNLTATIEGKTYTVNLEMIDKVIYLHFYNIHVSIPLSELLGVETTTQNFDINNINISLENDNGQLVIVVGLETLGELRVKVINTETGINLEISDLNINGIEILNTTASLESTSKVEVLKQDFEYITYEDITKTISSIKELVDLINNGAEISLDITYENIQITGNIIIDSNKAIKGLIDINGYEIELIYIDSKLYISVLGINLSCDLTDPNELIEVIEKVLNELGTETPKLAIDLEEILSSMILDLSDGIKLTVSGYEITLKDNLLTTDFGTISLTSNTESIVTPVGDYYEVENLYSYVDTILALVNSEAYELNIQTSIQYQEYLIGIEGVIYLDKDLNITGNLTATIEGKTYTVNLEMIDKVIYLHFYNIHVSIPLSELLGVETTTQNFDINNINISLENDNGQLVIVVGLETLGELRVKVINTETGINLEISDLNINGIEILNTTASLESTSKVEVLKQDFEYITYEDITKTISSIKELVDLINNGAEISLDITYENIQITGNIIIDSNKAIKGLIDINGYEIELIYIDSKLYISVLGINLSCDLTDPNELIEVIEKVLNELGTETPKLAIDLEEILSSMILDLSDGIKLTVSGYEITLKDNLLTTDFGTISITSNTDVVVAPVGDYYEVENLYSYIDTILALVNSEAYELNIETSIKYKTYTIDLNGVIYLDKDLNITGNLTATIEGKTYTVNLEMIDKVIYLHFYNIHVSIPLSELLGVETTTQNFDINNINISLENDNGQLVIVVGLETLGELRVKVINTETGINLEISDLNINGIEILNTTASLESTSKVEVLKQDFEYITYEDITKTISSIKELVDLINNGAEISLDITYENIQITGNIIIDSNKAIKGLIDINGYEIELIYIDSKLYISVLGINLSCDLTDPNELIEVIEKVLNELGTETPKLAIDLEEILSSMILDLSDGIKLTVSGYEITLKDNLLTTDFGTISLTSNTESIVTPVGDYYEVENLYSYIDTILALVNSEAYELNIETSIKYKTYTIDLNGVIYLDKDLNITGNLTATIEGKTYTVNLEMIEKVIYLHFYNIHVSIPLSELLGVETTTQNFDINNINISLENDNGQLVIVVGLETLGEIRVKVINTETGINLEISDLNINGIEILNTTASLESTSKVEVLKQDFEYITYEDITKTISSIKELVDLINNGAEISLDITYENIQITGNIIIDSNKAIKGLIDINGYEIELIYIDSKLYISVLGINLSCDLTDPNELIEVIEKVLNELGTETPKLAIDLEEILSSMILDLSDGIKLTVSGYEITLKDNLLTTDFGTISITSNTESIVTPVGDYYEVENLYSYIDTILALVNSEAYDISLNITYNDLDILVDLKVSKELNVAGTIELSVKDNKYVIELYLINKVLYVTFNELNIKIELDKLPSYIEKINELLGYYEVELPSTDLDINSILNEISISNKDGKLAILTPYGEFVLENIGNGLNISSDKINGSVVSAETPLDVNIDESVFYDVDHLLTDDMFELLKNEGYTLDISLAIDVKGLEIGISGTLDFDLKNLQIEGALNINVLGVIYQLDVYYYDGMIYGIIGNTTIKLTIADIISLFDIEIDLNTIFGQIFYDENKTNIGIHAEQIGMCYLVLSILINENVSLDISTLDLGAISIKDINVVLSVSDKKTISVPPITSNIIDIDSVRNIIELIEGLTENINQNDGFNVNLDIDLFGINLSGEILILKDLSIKADLIVFANDQKINLNITYLNNKLYLTFNTLNLVLETDNLTEIVEVITQLINDTAGTNIEINPTELLSGLELVLNSLLISSDEMSLDLVLSILTLENANLNMLLSTNGLVLNGEFSKDIIINNVSLSFENNSKITVNDSKYLEANYFFDLFRSLETGISSNGEFVLTLSGMEVLLPYEMLFKLDLIQLLKGDNVFEAIELELTITSTYYDPIILTILDGYIYLNSMDTKLKYQIPVYSLSDIDMESIDVSSIDLDNISNLLGEILGYINGIVIINTSNSLEISLSNDLLSILNNLLYDLTGFDIAISEVELLIDFSKNRTNFDIRLGLNAMGLDVGVILTANSTPANYVSHMTEADKEQFTLTEDFSEHPFAGRVMDILKIVSGVTALDFGTTGQGFNISIPLKSESSLINELSVNGDLGIKLDLPSILNGGDLFESFALTANVNINAKVLLFVKVNIKVQIFYVGDGFLYLIVNGDAAGINFEIADMLIDLRGLIEDSLGSTSEEVTQIYLNDLLNDIINGFDTSSTENSVTLSLSSSSSKVINTLWRQLIDLINNEVSALNVSALTSLIEGIYNFNIDVNGVDFVYTANEDQSFNNILISLKGYRHNTYTPTELPITISSTGNLADNHFESYKETANVYASIREEISTAKTMVSNLGEFEYTENYYNSALKVQEMLDGMSEIAKSSYTNTSVQYSIDLYKELLDAEGNIRNILEVYNTLDIGEFMQNYSTMVIASYSGYEYFSANNVIFDSYELNTYLEIYNEIAKNELAEYANEVNELIGLDNIDFANNLDATIVYKDDLSDLFNAFNALSRSYQEAFKTLYANEYQKLMLLVEEYNQIVTYYINEKIEEYIFGDMTLDEAMQKYIEYNFKMMRTYVLDPVESELMFSRLDNFIYNKYIREFDIGVGLITKELAKSSFIVDIPKLQAEYNNFSDEFKEYVTANMTELGKLYEPSLNLYKEEVNSVISQFNVDYQNATSGGYFDIDYKDYYFYDTIAISADYIELANKITYYYTLGSALDLKGMFNEHSYERFKLIYHLYSFINLVNSLERNVDEINNYVQILSDINNNFYNTYTFKKRIGLNSYYLTGTVKHSYFELFENSTSGSYANEIYQKYLSII